MGNQVKPVTGQIQVYLSQIQQGAPQELMFQSKLSTSTNYQTKLLKKIYPFNSASDNITGYIQKLNFFGQYIQCSNLMLPVYCYIRQTKGVCSDVKELEIYQEIYTVNIKDEIAARKNHNQRFTECQVWYLLYSIVNACRKFEPYKIKSGNLKTSHVMLNHQGHLKIKNVLTEPDIKRFALPNYFSPEQLKDMREETTNSKYQLNICQTFSIAIIILEICTFIDGQTFYDMYRMKLNESKLARAEEIMHKLNYSKLLVNLLRIMLSEYTDRPLPSQVYLTFKPYQQQISTLKPFKFDTGKIYESLQNSKVSVSSKYSKYSRY